MKKTYIVEIFIVTIVIAISALYLILSPFIGLMGAGTLGGFDDRVFSTSKVK